MIVISSHEKEKTMLEMLKKKIGGNIYQIKGKKKYKLVIADTKSLKYIIKIINGKLRYEYKIQNLINNIIRSIKGLNHIEPYIKPVDNENNLDKTHWLAGFVTGDGSFQIKAINKKNNRIEIRLNLQIDLKYKILLDQIKYCFGGYVYKRKDNNTYYYGSSSFSVADKLIKYFDKYRTSGQKWLQYIKWRTIWTKIKNKEHLTEKGIADIIKLKNKLKK